MPEASKCIIAPCVESANKKYSFPTQASKNSSASHARSASHYSVSVTVQTLYWTLLAQRLHWFLRQANLHLRTKMSKNTLFLAFPMNRLYLLPRRKKRMDRSLSFFSRPWALRKTLWRSMWRQQAPLRMVVLVRLFSLAATSRMVPHFLDSLCRKDLSASRRLILTDSPLQPSNKKVLSHLQRKMLKKSRNLWQLISM